MQPVTFVLPDDGDDATPRQYRTFEAGSCFCMDNASGLVYCFDNQEFSLDGGSFDARYMVYPRASSSVQNDSEYIMSFAEPNSVLRDRMLEVAQKQLIETGHDGEEYKNELYSRMAELADSKKDFGQLRYMIG